MKSFFILLAGCACLILGGCITEYEAKGLNEVENILVVEGIITGGESIITLSRSVNLTNDSPTPYVYVNDAIVSVECDDGTLIQAIDLYYRPDGRYVIPMGDLNFDRQYRLKIEVYEADNSANNGLYAPYSSRMFEYCSDYTHPIRTPEIDSVFWSKRDLGQPVNIHVATHSTTGDVMFYRWSYREDWEIVSDRRSFGEYMYPYYCWNGDNSRGLLVGSAEKTVFGQLTNIILEISPFDRKIEVLYRIKVKQNAISKQAYDYYANIKKNTRQTANIFSPVQSELKGNITCVTDPDRPVIGYVDFSTTTQSQLYIPYDDLAYEFAGRDWNCTDISQDSLMAKFMYIPETYVPYYWINEMGGRTLYYVYNRCIDCTFFGTTIKPDDWPNDHQ